MPTPKLSDALARQAGELYLQHGPKEGARLAGIPAKTFDSRVNVAVERGFINRADRHGGSRSPAAPAAPPIPANERQRFTDQVAALRGELRDAHRQINELEDYRSLIGTALDAKINPPQWQLKRSAASGEVGTPILFASDFQWGEVIEPRELDGVNAFNVEIARQRYKRLIERTIDIAFSHVGARAKYDGIVYLRGGDMIGGDIHAELAKTNDIGAIEQVVDLTDHEAAGIAELKKAFGSVRVISTGGNHGRTTLKPEAKLAMLSNFDTLSALMLSREFRGDKAVTFQTPISGDALFDVRGWRWLMTHGDKIGSGGGQGFIGPAATIARGMKKLSDYYAALGTLIDYQVMGHFHTPLELEYGWCNGSLPGYSEYAKSFRARPKGPVQWLFFCHPDRGVTSRWQLQLADARVTLAPEMQAQEPYPR